MFFGPRLADDPGKDADDCQKRKNAGSDNAPGAKPENREKTILMNIDPGLLSPLVLNQRLGNVILIKPHLHLQRRGIRVQLPGAEMVREQNNPKSQAGGIGQLQNRIVFRLRPQKQITATNIVFTQAQTHIGGLGF